MTNIKVFTTKFCPYCISLKEFLKEHNIEFQEVNVENDEQGLKEMVEKSGQMGVPVTVIDGNVVVGFDRERIKKLLNI